MIQMDVWPRWDKTRVQRFGGEGADRRKVGGGAGRHLIEGQ